MEDKNTNHRGHVSTHELKEELSGKLISSTSLVYELAKYVVAAIVLILTVHSLFLTIKIISGPSMLPNFISDSYVALDRRNWISYERGDVVILKYPGDPTNVQYIKRIVALPGEYVEIKGGSVYINDQVIKEPYLPIGLQTFPDVPRKMIKENEYFTLGDNRGVSNDSRFFGTVHRRYIIGKVISVVFEPPQE